MLKLLNIAYRYAGGQGIDKVSFEIQSGDFALLVGKTGAGKTTLFRLISLELIPQSGDIHLELMRAGSMKRSQLSRWRRRIGMVFQDLKLLDDRTLLENVKLAAMCEKNLPMAPKERALKTLSRVGLSHKLHSYPKQLSAGEQQRAAIARAVVNEPFLLLADEPVSHLDEETSAEIVGLLRQLNIAGTSMLIATHQPERFTPVNPKIIKVERGLVFA